MGHIRHWDAGPGCGKTRELGDEIADALADGYDPYEIHAMSYSKTAAGVLTARVPLPDECVSTIHSAGYQELDGVEVLGVEKKGGKDKKDATDLWNEEFPYFTISRGKNVVIDPADGNGETWGDELLAQVDKYRHMLLPVEKWRNESAVAFWNKWRAFKHRHGVIDFTDMIDIPYRNNSLPPHGAKVVIVDEWNDSTPLERARVMQMQDETDLIVVAGDDDQSINDYRGVISNWGYDIERELRKKVVSHRMPQVVTKYSQEWIGRIRNRIPKIVRSLDDAPIGELRFEPWLNLQDEIADVVDMAYDRAKSDKTVMLLTSTNYMADRLVAPLKNKGVAFHNPYRTRNGRWNPLHPSREGAMSYYEKVEAFLEFIGGKHTKRTIRAISTSIHTSGIITNNSKMETELRGKPADFQVDIDNWLSEGVYDSMRDGGLQWFIDKASSDTLRRNFIYAQKLMQNGEKEPRVIIGTIHSVKGHEADSVFLFPDLSGAAKNELEYGDGVQRLFYVGMTRAKQELLLCGTQYERSAIEWI